MGIYGVIQMRNVNLITWTRVAAIEMVPEVEFGIYFRGIYCWVGGWEVSEWKGKG